MQKLLLLLTSVLFGTAAAQTQMWYPVRDRLEVTSLDGTWQFFAEPSGGAERRLEDNGEWRAIQVPGNWELQGVKTPDYGRDLKKLTGIYKRDFLYQDDWKGRDVILRLDGVQNGFTAYVNGQEVGTGHSAHTMHQFCITPFLKEGRNEMRIEVTTYSEYWLFDVCDAWSYTGIKRSVELFSVPKEGSLADVVFTSKVNEDNSADITVKVKTNGRGAAKITASLLDERYNHVADMQASVQDASAVLTAHIARPRLWNAETPNLYRLDVKLFDAEGHKLQNVEEKVGIREIRVENCKVLLNNREIFLRGACLSENEALEGGAMTPLHRRQQLEQMKAANINFIRTAHYPQDPLFTRLCDEMGFYVCEEIPFASRGDEYLKTNSPEVIAELKARAKATIDRDRNCPSIILWSHGNENKIYSCQDSVLLFTKQYDPTRLRGVPQCTDALSSYIRRPSKFVDVICAHYANDDVLAEACEKSQLPIINTEYAHSLGTAFGELEHKYNLFRREPNIVGGSVWCYQDQSVLTRHFNQQKQVMKGVRIDSVRYIDSYGLNPLPNGLTEKGKEGADGIVYGDGYPQEDYFELAQVYTPAYISEKIKVESEKLEVTVENRFDFISLHGYGIKWQLRKWQQVLGEGTVWLSAKAHETENVGIPTSKDATHLCMQVHRPDGSLCHEKNIRLNDDTDYSQLLRESKGNGYKNLYTFLKTPLLRVGRPLEIGLDYRRKGLWQPYLLEPTNVKTKKQHGGYHVTCKWVKQGETNNYINGDVTLTSSRDGTVTIDYMLTPSDSIGGKFLDYGLAFALPQDYDQVAWLGQGPFSQTPDKTAYNNCGTWQLHKDDIRFYGNRADVGILTVLSKENTATFCSGNNNIHLESIEGCIVLTDNQVVGTYGTKFGRPQGKDANMVGVRTGRITIKANVSDLLETIFGPRRFVNPERPYMESYGK